MHRERSPASAAYVAAAVLIVLVLAAAGAGLLMWMRGAVSPLAWLCCLPALVFVGCWVVLFLWMAHTVA